MKREKSEFALLVVSISFFFLLALSFLTMPLGDGGQNGKAFAYTVISGGMFWISIVGAIVTQFILGKRRKKWLTKNNVKNNLIQHKIGIFLFFKNKYAVVSDVALVISLIGLAMAIIATDGVGYICYVFIALLVFSFSMHCVFNGKNYYFVANGDALLKAAEEEKRLSSKKREKKK